MNKPRLSQTQKIYTLLASKACEKFTARQIAEQIIVLYPEDYAEKRQNSRFNSENDFINQVVAEIGAQKEALLRTSEHIHLQDKPRPRLYWFDSKTIREQQQANAEAALPDIEVSAITHESTTTTVIDNLSEHDLYPLLIEFLSRELGLFTLRIDEKRSGNSRGQNGNQWLHPDIVAMQPLDKHWNELVKSCVKHGSGQNVRLWSFEVKKELNGSNVRSSFFQAVSNSSWANEGYLVATSISNNEVESELRMLSALHGIGVILLKTDNPTESEILLPARRKEEADWQSINRILNENKDFKSFIELVSIYYQTGRIRQSEWNK